MKKSTRNIMFVVIAILFILCLISFNVNGVKKIFRNNNMAKFAYEDVEEEMAYDYAVAETEAYRMTNDMAAEVPMAAKSTAGYAGGNGIDNGTEVTTGRKLIKNIYIDCETNDFDKTYDLVKNKIDEYAGILDSENFNNGRVNNKSKRNCYFNIRVPKDSIDKFVVDISSNINILNKSENVEDVTDNYNDTLKKLDILKVEEGKLTELLSQATKIEDLVTIEDKLNNIRYQIESIERKLKNLDKRIDYSTINLNLSEVVVYTKPQDVKPTKEGLQAAFKKNLEDTKNFIINTGYYIYTHIPAICLALVVIIIIFIILIIISSVTDGGDGDKKDKEVMVEEKEEKNDEKKENKVDDKDKIKIDNKTGDKDKIKNENKINEINDKKNENKKEDIDKSQIENKKQEKVDEKEVEKEIKKENDIENKIVREKIEKEIKEIKEEAKKIIIEEDKNDDKNVNKKDDDGYTMTDLDFVSTK